MASLTKHESRYQRADGKRREFWRVRWTTAEGRERTKQFTTRKEAQRYLARVALGDVGGSSLTVLDLARMFVTEKEQLAREGELKRSTADQYETHVERHLAPYPLAAMKLVDAEVAHIAAYFAGLAEAGVSLALRRKIQMTVRAVFNLAIAHGVRRDNPAKIAKVQGRKAERRGSAASVPPKAASAALIMAADARAEARPGKPAGDRGRAAAAIRLLMLAGLRPSELRALKRDDLQLESAPYTVTIRRAADKWNQIEERPKTHHGRRTITIGADTAAALRRWILAAPRNPAGLVFPNEAGRTWAHDGLYRNTWIPVARAAGLARKSDVTGRIEADFPLYHLRHVAASIKIALGWRGKRLQTFMGHHSAQFTEDVYGHLYPADDPAEEARQADAAERFLTESAVKGDRG